MISDSKSGDRISRWTWLALVFILLVAAGFRFAGLDWDRGYLFHPDERKILLVASDLRLPNRLSEFLSPNSPLNPRFFAYGSFPIYLLKALSAFAPATAFAVPWSDSRLVGLALLGRALSGAFDLGTIALLFFLARRWYGDKVGLLAAACSAVTVLQIQLSHFYAVDTLLTFLIVATIFFAARFADRGQRGDAVLMSVAFGLAMATKVSAAPLAVPMVVAVVHRGAGERETGRWGEFLPLSHSPALLASIVRHWCAQIWSARGPLARVFGVALALFVVTQPYALLDPIGYFGQVGTESLVARGW
ncbi:MAG: glycosyltransferase family 39 protein, partial [Chloroflexota bacterium]|nr:glycosyltransferase family 39 protein [Chloroflexota bacterium]